MKCRWPNVSIHPHRFGGTAFHFGSPEFGYTHVQWAERIMRKNDGVFPK